MERKAPPPGTYLPFFQTEKRCDDPDRKTEGERGGLSENSEKFGTGVRERIAVKGADREGRDFFQGTKGRRLREEEKIPAGEMDLPVGRSISGNASPRDGPIFPPISPKKVRDREIQNREGPQVFVSHLFQEFSQPVAFRPFPIKPAADVDRHYLIEFFQKFRQKDIDVNPAARKDGDFVFFHGGFLR